MCRKIHAIGDSITFLDGVEVPGVGEIVGYQDVLRSAGFSVKTSAYSGATLRRFREDCHFARHVSLYDLLFVEKAVNISQDEEVILFAGTNDILQGLCLGSMNSNNLQETYPALVKILQYLKSQAHRVHVFSPIYSARKSHTEENMATLIQAMDTICRSEDVSFYNMYQAGFIHEGNHEQFLYDGLHPNNYGMRRIGEYMLDKLK